MLKKHHYLVILFLLTTLLTTPLYAANVLHQAWQDEGKNDEQETAIGPKPITGYYNYTLKYNKKIDNTVDLDNLEDEKDNFKDNNIATKIKNKQGAVFFMTIMSHKQTQALSKFFFINRDPNVEINAIKKVQTLFHCHTITHTTLNLSPHVLFQLLGWLQQTQDQYIPVFIYANSPICVTCHAMVSSFFKLNMLSNPKGCHSANSFNIDNINPLAQAYIKKELTFPLAKKLLLPTLRLDYERKISLLENNVQNKEQQNTALKDKHSKLQSVHNALKEAKDNLAERNTQLNKNILLLENEAKKMQQNLSQTNAQATKLLLEKEDLQKQLNKLKTQKINWQQMPKRLRKENVYLKNKLNEIFGITNKPTAYFGYNDGQKVVDIKKMYNELPYSPLTGHTGYVYSVAISADNQYIVSGSTDKTIRIWDLGTGEEVNYSPLVDNKNGVYTAIVDNNNEYIVSISRGPNKTIHIWDFKTSQHVRTLQGHTDYVNSVAITKDNKYIVSGSGDKTIRIWDFTTGKEIRLLQGHTGEVFSVAVTADNQYIVSGSYDNTIRIWDLATGKQVRKLQGHTNTVRSVAISKDNQHIVSGSEDKTIRIWDFTTGQHVRTLQGHTNYVNSVAVTNRYIVSGSYDKTIRIWDFTTGKEVAYSPLQGHTGCVTSVAISSDNKYIVSGSRDKTLRIWDWQLLRYLHNDDQKEAEEEVFDID